MASADLDPSLGPALGHAHPLGSAGAAQMVPACETLIVDVLSAEVARRDATFTAGVARAVALVRARQFVAGRKIAWGRGDVHRAISVVDMAGGGQHLGATLFVPAAHGRDPCRVLVLVRALRIRRTRGIAGAGVAPGRGAGPEGV